MSQKRDIMYIVYAMYANIVVSTTKHNYDTFIGTMNIFHGITENCPPRNIMFIGKVYLAITLQFSSPN